MSEQLSISREDLPYWMQQAQQTWDWGIFLAIGFALLAAWPFLLQPGLPRTNASENYVFMAENYDRALREGHLYPRWSPDTLGGFGAPIPNYYPPLAPYSAGLITALFTNNPVDGIRMVYVLAFCLAAVSTYLFVKHHLGAAHGFFAATLYIFSPYFANIVPHIQGELPISIALALLPALLAAVDRLQAVGRAQDSLVVSVLTAALLLTHPPIALSALVISLVLALYNRIRLSGPAALPTFFVSILLGCGLAAFFWIPALLEYNLVIWQLRDPLRPVPLALQQLIAPFQPVDLREMIPRTQLTLGLPLALLALIGLVTIIIRRRNAPFILLFLVAGALVVALGVYQWPNQTWLMGLITFCCVIVACATMNLADQLPLRWGRLLLAGLVVVLLFSTQSVWLAPRWPDLFGRIDRLEQINYEQQGAGIAVLPPHAAIPTTIGFPAPTNRFLISGYQSGNINKILPLSASPGIQINVLRHTSQQDVFQVRLNTITRLDILTAYFPGWEAFANNRPLNIQQNPVTGLMSIDAPPLNGELTLTLRPTATRQASWIISAVALAGIVISLRFKAPQPAVLDYERLALGQVRLLSISALSFLGVLLLFAVPNAPYPLHARPGYGLDSAFSVNSRTQDGLEIIAYRVNQQVFAPGDQLHLKLYWETIRPLTRNYKTQVYLLNLDQGTRWQRTALYTPGDYPTSRWRRYSYLQDDYILNLSPTIVPGRYGLVVEVFDCRAQCTPNDRVTFFDSAGAELGPALTLPGAILIDK